MAFAAEGASPKAWLPDEGEVLRWRQNLLIHATGELGQCIVIGAGSFPGGDCRSQVIIHETLNWVNKLWR